MDWMNRAQDRDKWRVLVNTVMNLWVPQNAGKFLSRCKTGSLSRQAQCNEISQVIAPCYCTFTFCLYYDVQQNFMTRFLSVCKKNGEVH
jgi:hypothetical protein